MQVDEPQAQCAECSAKSNAIQELATSAPRTDAELQARVEELEALIRAARHSSRRAAAAYRAHAYASTSADLYSGYPDLTMWDESSSSSSSDDESDYSESGEDDYEMDCAPSSSSAPIMLAPAPVPMMRVLDVPAAPLSGLVCSSAYDINTPVPDELLYHLYVYHGLPQRLILTN